MGNSEVDGVGAIPIELGAAYRTTTHFTNGLTPVTTEVTIVIMPVLLPGEVNGTTYERVLF